MGKNNNILLSGASTILHSVIAPLFVLVFTIYYKPYAIYELLQMQHASFTFNTTILFCIVLVSISITRGWLYIIGKYKRIPKYVYFLWCLGEMVVCSLFISLYVVLMTRDQMSFFETTGLAFLQMTVTCIYPYGFLWLGLELYAKNSEETTPAEDASLIKFYDEHKKLRLVIAPEAVIFIQSEDNYVNINYLDQSRTKKFVLRSSMRALEETLSKHGLIRCHRSYFINPSFIKIVHRDSSGLIVAELKQEGFESIPISRKYQHMINRLI